MDEKWTIGRVLHWTQEHFEKKRVRTPRLDAELIIAHALGTDRVALYIESKKPLHTEERDRIKELIRRRLDGEPVAYITGVKEFWGMPFHVTPDVLVPRPETEEIVEEALLRFSERRDEPIRFLDIGTGSGCLPAALCSEFPHATGIAADISEAALGIARENIESLGFAERIQFRTGDLFGALSDGDGTFDLIVGNPPYVPVGEIQMMAPEVKHETRIALDGGIDGLDLVRRIVLDASGHMKNEGWLFLEIGAGQDEGVAEIEVTGGLVFNGFRNDLARIPRVARWQKTSGL